jgi:hypothetical protein
LPAAKLVLVSGQEGAEPRAPVDAVFSKGESVEDLLACLEWLLRPELG